MISKKYLQNNSLAYHKILFKKIIYNNILKTLNKNFATNLIINFSHNANALPLETLKIKKKINSGKNNLNDMLLKKLSNKISIHNLKK